MSTNSDPDKDPSRLAIAVFIVATTLTIAATHFSVPVFLFIPISAFFLGLVISAVLAFLFLLAKGYELRYGKKKNNLIDKYNYILYNAALSAYALVVAIIALGYILNYLNHASKEGHTWASVATVLLYIGVIAYMNRRGVTELYLALKQALSKKTTRK